MSRKSRKLTVAFLSFSLALLLTPQLMAQVDAKSGFVAAPGAKASTGRSTEPDLRPVAKSPPQSEKVKPFGNLMIIYFEEPGLLHYSGDIAGLEATSPITRGEKKLDARSPASRAYLRFLDQRQDHYITRIEQALSREIEAVFRYRAAVTGIALVMSPAEGKLVERIPGVLRVIPDSVEPLDTDRGPLFIGADEIWDGTGTGGLPGTQGEGVIVGIIDSGINMDHPSFAVTGSDGFTHTNPNGAGVFLGWCDPMNPNFDPSYPCNDKLIGGWDYMDAFCDANPATCTESDGPGDDNGHGSHTASTTAGNILIDPGSLGITMSGVSPHSNIIAYDACYVSATGQGLCPFSGTSAGADQAILDGVDAINYSISGGNAPWGGDIDTFFLENVLNGTFVSASAGNAGPTAGTVSHLGPWVTTVAASTHDRGVNTGTLTDLAGGAPPGDLPGSSTTQGYGPATIVHASGAGDAQCLNPFAPGTWSNTEIVVCDRGTIARVLKCAHVAAGGAGGCVLANVTDNTGAAPVLSPDPHVIPSLHVNTATGDTLRAWLATPGAKTARIVAPVVVTDPAAADIMADFSSRGPNAFFDVLKPDVSNPGSNVLAAIASGDPLFPPPEFAWFSGTSMSSPHTAGSGALLSALHPDWTPPEIKSALMMTANSSMKKEDGITDADPWDIGAGRVDLSKAGQAGLVLDETYANFIAANPAIGGAPESLNIASLKQTACVIQCSWTRNFSSPLTLSAQRGVPVSWTVSSTSSDGITVTADPFQVESGNDVAVEFTAEDPGATPGDPPGFAEVIMTPNDGSPELHMPVVIAITEDNFPTQVDFQTTDPTSFGTVRDLQYFEAIPNLTAVEYGLVQPIGTDVVLNEDPTNGDPYDNLSQVFWKTVIVPPGAKVIVAATESDEAPDVDLFIGTGGLPSSGTEQCSSTTATATEYCQVDNPTGGAWWILVQNWQGSASQPDLIRLLDGVVPATDAGNMIVTGPASVPAGQPFDVTVSWNLSTLSRPAGSTGPELWIGAYSLAKDGVSQPIETTIVTITLESSVLFADGFESGDTSSWSATIP